MSKRKRQKAVVPPASPPPARTRAWESILLCAILAGYLLAAGAAAVIVPTGPPDNPKLIPPDETAHWGYITALAAGKGLLRFTSSADNYEAHQPPLYYLSAVWTAWLGGEQGTKVGRLWSVLLGALTLLVAWKASQYLLGARFWPRLAAVGALAFLPGRLFIASSVSNDPMLELWAAVVTWLCLRAVHEGLGPRGAPCLGACLGLALLTKTSALGLAPVVALALALEPSWRPAGARRLLRNLAVVFGLVAVIWGWWVARNMLLYGEPLAMHTFERIFTKDRATPQFFLSRGITWSGYWTLVAYQTWLSLWGVFGQATVYMPGLYYRLGGALAALGGLGLIAGGVRRAREASPAKEPVRLCWELAILLILLALAALVQFNTVFYQAQARYLLGASVPLACLLSAGICGLGRRPDRPLPAVGLILVLAALAVWALIAHATGSYSLSPPAWSAVFLPPGLQ